MARDELQGAAFGGAIDNARLIMCAGMGPSDSDGPSHGTIGHGLIMCALWPGRCCNPSVFFFYFFFTHVQFAQGHRRWTLHVELRGKQGILFPSGAPYKVQTNSIR